MRNPVREAQMQEAMKGWATWPSLLATAVLFGVWQESWMAGLFLFWLLVFLGVRL